MSKLELNLNRLDAIATGKQELPGCDGMGSDEQLLEAINRFEGRLPTLQELIPGQLGYATLRELNRVQKLLRGNLEKRIFSQHS